MSVVRLTLQHYIYISSKWTNTKSTYGNVHFTAVGTHVRAFCSYSQVINVSFLYINILEVCVECH